MVVPAIEHGIIIHLRQDGMYGSIGEGLDPKDEKKLYRSNLTAEIIHGLEEKHVVFVNSPPMTGKTSLVTLVSLALVNKHKDEKNKAAVFNFSGTKIIGNQTFKDAFKRHCKVDWRDAVLEFPRQYMVYVILDEAQVIFNEINKTSLRHESAVFWLQVSLALSYAAHNVRFLIFAAYDPSVVYTQFISMDFHESRVFTIMERNFNREVQEYVSKWFEGIACLVGSSSSMESFCANLEELTGRHVGLCATDIRKLNKLYFSRKESGSKLPSADDWIRMLQGGSLYRSNDNALFDALAATRAVETLSTLEPEVLDWLERFASGTSFAYCHDMSDLCLRKGIWFKLSGESRSHLE